MSNFVVELVQWRFDARVGWMPNGCTLIIGSSGELRYVIRKRLDRESRLIDMQLFLDGVGLRHASLFRADTPQQVSALASAQLKALHLGCC